MIDVLYIKGEPSSNNDLEMLYSLRTLERHVKDLGTVFITGQCPEFIDQGKVKFLPIRDIGSPMINHWWKVHETIMMTKISKNFALMYDDIFFIADTKLTKYPFYQKGFLHQQTDGGEVYQESLRNAAEWLICRGKTIYNHELHVPCIYNGPKFIRMAEIYSKKVHEFPGMAVRSVYANLFEFNHPYRKDIKFRTQHDKVEDIIGTTDCFSVSDQIFGVNALPWLKKNYTERSKWEK